jgi:large subunit ribosomal protein L30
MVEKIEKDKKTKVKKTPCSEAKPTPVIDCVATELPVIKKDPADCAKKNHKVCKSTCDTSNSVLDVKQIGSAIGCTQSQINSLKGLGLGKIGKKAVLKDNNCVRGLIRKVSHLVEVGCINE